MAILEVREIMEGRTAGMGPDGFAWFQRAYHAHTDTDTDGPYQVANHPTIPVWGLDVHPDNPNAIMQDLSIEPQAAGDSHRDWTVICKYSEKPIADGNSGVTVADAQAGGDPTSNATSPSQVGNNADPDTQPLIIELSTKQSERPPIGGQDLNGKPVKNGAGVPFANIRVPTAVPIVTLKWWGTSGDIFYYMANQVDFVNTVNSSQFLPYVPYSLRMTKYDPKQVWKNHAYRVEITAEMEVRPDLWYPYKELNAGLHIKDPLNPGQVKEISDGSGGSIKEPVALTADGTAVLPPGATSFNYCDFSFFLQNDFKDMF